MSEYDATWQFCDATLPGMKPTVWVRCGRCENLIRMMLPVEGISDFISSNRICPKCGARMKR